VADALPRSLLLITTKRTSAERLCVATGYDDGSERREAGAVGGVDRKPMAAALTGSAILRMR